MELNSGRDLFANQQQFQHQKLQAMDDENSSNYYLGQQNQQSPHGCCVNLLDIDKRVKQLDKELAIVRSSKPKVYFYNQKGKNLI